MIYINDKQLSYSNERVDVRYVPRMDGRITEEVYYPAVNDVVGSLLLSKIEQNALHLHFMGAGFYYGGHINASRACPFRLKITKDEKTIMEIHNCRFEPISVILWHPYDEYIAFKFAGNCVYNANLMNKCE